MFAQLGQMFAQAISFLSTFMYSYLLIIMLLAAGIYFSLRTGLVQLRMLPEAVRSVFWHLSAELTSLMQSRLRFFRRQWKDDAAKTFKKGTDAERGEIRRYFL